MANEGPCMEIEIENFKQALCCISLHIHHRTMNNLDVFSFCQLSATFVNSTFDIKALLEIIYECAKNLN